MKTSWLLWLLLALAVLISMLLSLKSYSRSQLSLEYKVSIQVEYNDPEGTEYQTIAWKEMSGIGGIQVALDPVKKHRMVIKVRKPINLAGIFKVRMPTRVDGVNAPTGLEYAQIIFGPQRGCPGIGEDACKPITEDDIGNIELRLDLKQAEQTAFGVFLFRPYADPLDFAIRPSIKYKDKIIKCGSSIKKGLWLFAKRARADTDPMDTISLCALDPKKKWDCAGDKEDSMKIRINKKGRYLFVAWNKSPTYSTCEIFAK